MRKTLALWSGVMLIASFAAYADTYHEAPMLAALVSAGSLPPVDDRLPEVPQVVEPQASLGTDDRRVRRDRQRPASAAPT